MDSYIPMPQRDIGQAVPDADGRRVFDQGAWDGGDGAGGAGQGEGGEAMEIVGLRKTRKTVVTGVEMFKKLLDEGMAGDNVGLLLRGIEKDEVERGQVMAKPGSIKPHTEVRGIGVRAEEGRRRAAHAVLQRIPAAVLFSDHGRDGGSGVVFWMR